MVAKGEPPPDAQAAPPQAHESLVSRETAAEVPSTGPSCFENCTVVRCHFGPPRHEPRAAVFDRRQHRQIPVGSDHDSRGSHPAQVAGHRLRRWPAVQTALWIVKKVSATFFTFSHADRRSHRVSHAARAGLRRGGTPRLSRMRAALLRLRPGAVHKVRHRVRRRVLLQGPRCLPVLELQAHGQPAVARGN